MSIDVNAYTSGEAHSVVAIQNRLLAKGWGSAFVDGRSLEALPPDRVRTCLAIG